MSPWVINGAFGRGVMLRLVLLVAFCLPAQAALSAEPLKGVALVIGNADYRTLPRLANPAADARAIETLLDRLGFDVVETTDRDARRLKRDLEDFAEDASQADVAILYYSGHGIEAGGENFLVPVDADLAALDDADERLAPLSATVARLQATTPIVIVLLDACRTNPFPAGASLKRSAGVPPAPIAASGLGEARGALPMPGKTVGGRENLGSVIGFAAAPGQVALDGETGGNSPYAAAVLRHLDAVAGEEFGTVMRMVAEEVYLKTGGRQRPWINESLRRFLHFGAAPAAESGDDARILAGRRQLLIAIATLPEWQRLDVERVAGDAGVPMDALYALLKVLGAEAPSDPDELRRVLTSEANRLKEIIEQHRALTASDPETARDLQTAREAFSEGALDVALELYDRAKAGIVAREQALDQAEDSLKARRIENGAVFFESGKTAAFTQRYERAIADFVEAFDQVRRWDDDLAQKYKAAEAAVYLVAGFERRDTALLEKAVSAFEAALAIDGTDAGLSERLELARNMAIAARSGRLDALEEIDGAFGGPVVEPKFRDPTPPAPEDVDSAKAQVAALEQALDGSDPDADPAGWARLQRDRFAALVSLGFALDTAPVAAEADRLRQKWRDETRAFTLADARKLALAGDRLQAAALARRDRSLLEQAEAVYGATLESFKLVEAPDAERGVILARLAAVSLRLEAAALDGSHAHSAAAGYTQALALLERGRLADFAEEARVGREIARAIEGARAASPELLELAIAGFGKITAPIEGTPASVIQVNRDLWLSLARLELALIARDAGSMSGEERADVLTAVAESLEAFSANESASPLSRLVSLQMLSNARYELSGLRAEQENTALAEAAGQAASVLARQLTVKGDQDLLAQIGMFDAAMLETLP